MGTTRDMPNIAGPGTSGNGAGPAPVPREAELPARLDEPELAAFRLLCARMTAAEREMAHAQELWALFQALVRPRYGMEPGDRFDAEGGILRTSPETAPGNGLPGAVSGNEAPTP